MTEGFNLSIKQMKEDCYFSSPAPDFIPLHLPAAEVEPLRNYYACVNSYLSGYAAQLPDDGTDADEGHSSSTMQVYLKRTVPPTISCVKYKVCQK